MEDGAMVEDESQPLEDAELLTEVVRAIVSHPSDVVVEETMDGIRKILSVRSHPSDCGKIIGKEGRMAEVLRVLFNSVGTIQGYPIMVRVIDMSGNRERSSSDSGFYRSAAPKRPRTRTR